MKTNSFEDLVSDLSPGWSDVFNEGLLSAAWGQVASLAGLVPSAAQVLNCFRDCSPDEVRVCIIGQDPYADKALATGRAFSRTTVAVSSGAVSVTAVSWAAATEVGKTTAARIEMMARLTTSIPPLCSKALLER